MYYIGERGKKQEQKRTDATKRFFKKGTNLLSLKWLRSYYQFIFYPIILQNIIFDYFNKCNQQASVIRHLLKHSPIHFHPYSQCIHFHVAQRSEHLTDVTESKRHKLHIN